MSFQMHPVMSVAVFVHMATRMAAGVGQAVMPHAILPAMEAPHHSLCGMHCRLPACSSVHTAVPPTWMHACMQLLCHGGHVAAGNERTRLPLQAAPLVLLHVHAALGWLVPRRGVCRPPHMSDPSLVFSASHPAQPHLPRSPFGAHVFRAVIQATRR